MVVYIEPFTHLPKVHFYTIRLDNQEDNETDRFIDRFYASGEYRPDVEIIIAWMKEIGEKRGALPAGDEQLFRAERNAVALPPPTAYGNNLRLYGFICSDDVVILGGGGRKTTRKAQHGDTAAAFHQMNQIADVVRHRLTTGDIWIKDQKLEGAFDKLILPS